LRVPTRAPTTAIILFAVVVCGSAREARADYLFTPFIGGVFGRETAFALFREEGQDNKPVIFGGAAGWLSSGFLGVEGEFAYGPHFFERDNPLSTITSSSVATLTGNVIVAVPRSVTGYSLRPYVIGGLGLTHSAISYLGVVPDPVDDNSLAFNVGGGAIGFLTQRTGVRFELRHFRTFGRQPNEVTLEESSKLSFWRFTVGVVIRR